MPILNESWQEITEFPFYEISTLGRIRRRMRNVANEGRFKYRKIQMRKDSRYCQIDLYKPGEGVAKWHLVHRLMWQTFRGPIPPDMQVCHNDGDPTNNRLENLRLDTSLGNNRDRYKHGTMPRGESHPMVKLTEDQAREVYRLATSGASSQQEIANRFGISRPTVTAIKAKRLWAHLWE